MRLTNQFWILLLSSQLLISCAGLVKIPEFNVYATLPASRDGVRVNVLTGEYVKIPKEKWILLERRTLKMMPEDYAVIKKAFYNMCVGKECAQQLNLISHIFENIDAGLGKTQGVK